MSFAHTCTFSSVWVNYNFILLAKFSRYSKNEINIQYPFWCNLALFISSRRVASFSWSISSCPITVSSFEKSVWSYPLRLRVKTCTFCERSSISKADLVSAMRHPRSSLFQSFREPHFPPFANPFRFVRPNSEGPIMVSSFKDSIWSSPSG